MFDAIFAPQALLDELATAPGCRRCSTASARWPQAEAAVGVIPAAAAEAIAAACRAELLRRRPHRAEGRGLGQSGRAARARAARGRRRRGGGLRALRRDQPGHRRHGRDARQPRAPSSSCWPTSHAVTAACAALADSAPRDAHGRAHAAPAGAADDVRPQGRDVARRRARGPAARRSTRATALAVQLGGAAGTLAALGEHGPEVVRRIAGDLGLAEPVLPWHTSRVRVAALGSALATLAGALGKIALDVVLMAQTEVGEVSEPAGEGRGGSSTLRAQAQSGRIDARRSPVHAGRRPSADLLTGSLVQEHERAAGAWQAEWDGIAGALAAAGGAAVEHGRGARRPRRVDPERMHANLAATRGLIMSERLVFALAERLGREDAHTLVREAGSARRASAAPTLRDELAADRGCR